MAKIFEMSPHLADLIAAGEVVERPGSVVKELAENSIDAGATSITVEIRSGGMAMIRVTDNGCGIAAEDVETAFLRHATSKLRDERGLESIGTLGFRGEALAAIAAVSRVELITRERGASEGTRIVVEGGVTAEKSPVGCPEGTTIIIRDLFYNTPARLKFMKNDRAEGSNVTSVVTRIALSHPEVSVRYIKEGKEECHTPGDGRMDSCVYSTLGRDIARGLLRAEGGNDGIEVTGLVSSPAGCRGNRTWQFFFLNGRFIKSKLLQAALEQAYKNSLFTGRFPVCVLDIRMSPSAVDVNVHPTKMEVRFTDERKAFDAVYWTVRSALERENSSAEIDLSRSTEKMIKHVLEERPAQPAEKKNPFERTTSRPAFLSGTAEQLRKDYGVNAFKPSAPAFAQASAFGKDSAPKRSELHDGTRVPYQTSIPMPPATHVPAAGGVKTEEQRPVQPAPSEKEEEKQELSFRFIGEAMDTYLLVEKDGSIFVIDKHAAHERMLFDRLKATVGEPQSQMLISPIVCSVGVDDASILEENEELLSRYGFDISNFGDGSVILRRVPADIDMGDPSAFMEELAESLRKEGKLGLEAMRDGVMHTVACKAAIKAGTPSEPESVYGLVEKVLRGEVRYCPHGRPVMMEITKAQLDRSFKRI